MTTYAVTGATGKLGALAVEALLGRGVAPQDVVAVVRTPDKATALAERGVRIRRGDYDDAASLKEAFAGVDRLLLVSGSEVGKRADQHRNAVEAARDAGVALIAYTSLTRADSSDLSLAAEHKVTEQILASVDVPSVVLRNNWYIENYTEQIAGHLERGIVGAAGGGRIAAASRADYAEVAALVLTGEGHAGATYELAGPAFALADLARVITEVSGTDVTYTDVSAEELVTILSGAGLDEGTARFVAGLDTAIAGGALDIDSGDLPRLLGRPATPVAEVVRAAL